MAEQNRTELNTTVPNRPEPTRNEPNRKITYYVPAKEPLGCPGFLLIQIAVWVLLIQPHCVLLRFFGGQLQVKIMGYSTRGDQKNGILTRIIVHGT